MKQHEIVRFGPFELSLDTAELRKQGIRIRLQTKPFQVLSALLERPGDVLTREELQRRIWPETVLTGSENALNTAASRLRFALGDSVEHPTYIETLSRVGYRFIARCTSEIRPAVDHRPRWELSGDIGCSPIGRT